MGAPSFDLKQIPGLRNSESRAVAFLWCEQDKRIDAYPAFTYLGKVPKRYLLDSFDYWIAGGTSDIRFHGWPGHPRYRGCFVFKWKEKRLNMRLYGFLCNPKQNRNRSFQACVLCYFASKAQWETDYSILDRICEIHETPAVLLTCQQTFGDVAIRGRQWVN